jgi:hypothetical protein
LNELEYDTIGRIQKYTYSDNKRKIPRTVTHLTIYHIPEELPQQLVCLNIPKEFTGSLKHYKTVRFPETLHTLKIPYSLFSESISLQWFPQITDLTIYDTFNDLDLSDDIFDSIVTLTIDTNILRYPKKLYSLIFSENSSSTLFSSAQIPEYIKELTIFHNYWPALKIIDSQIHKSPIISNLQLNKLNISELYWKCSAKYQFIGMKIPFPKEIKYLCDNMCSDCKRSKFYYVDQTVRGVIF